MPAVLSCHPSRRLSMLYNTRQTRDVKRSSKIRTSNKTFEFGFVFRPFDIRLLTAFYWMPLFVFDHDCVDRSCIWTQGGAAVMSTPVIATGRFCWPWPGVMGGMHGWVTTVGATWVGTCGKVKPWDHVTHCWGLCGRFLGGGGKEQSGQARRMA